MPGSSNWTPGSGSSIGAGEEGSQNGRWKSGPLQALDKIQRYRLEPPLGKEKLLGLGGNTPGMAFHNPPTEGVAG